MSIYDRNSGRDLCCLWGDTQYLSISEHDHSHYVTTSEPRNEGKLMLEGGTSSDFMSSRILEDKCSIWPVMVDDVER